MKALACILALSISTSGFAQDQAPPAVAADVPMAAPIAKGAPAPDDGVFMTTPAAAQVGQACKACKVERDELRKELDAYHPPEVKLSPPVTWIIVGVASALVLGFAGGYVIGK